MSASSLVRAACCQKHLLHLSDARAKTIWRQADRAIIPLHCLVAAKSTLKGAAPISTSSLSSGLYIRTSQFRSPSLMEASAMDNNKRARTDAAGTAGAGASGEKKLQLYSLATPNGQKIGVALEEMGIPYDAHTIDIFKNTQFEDWYVKINPNSKIPSIVDPNGPGGKEVAMMESCAILIYLAEKTGKFLSKDPIKRLETLQWLFFQAGHVGPMSGQYGHFHKYAKAKCDHPYPEERYTTEVKRLLGVLEHRLEGQEYLIDDGYSIADMATFPWIECIRGPKGYNSPEMVAPFKNVSAYMDRCLARPAVQRGMQVTPFPERK